MGHDSVSVASVDPLWPVELGFRHALLALLMWQLAQWIYHQLTMSAMERKAKVLNLPPYSLPVLGSTLRAIVCTPRYLDMTVELTQHFQNRPYGLFVVGTPDNIFVSTPGMFEDVLKTQFERFDRGAFFRENMFEMLGNGIFSADGVAWAQLRKTACNLFSMNALRDAMATSVHKRVPVLFSVFQRGVEATDEPLNLTELLNKFTMEVFAEIGFGVDLGCLDSDEDHPFQKAFDSAQAILFLRFIRPAWLWKTMRWLNIGREKELKPYIQAMNDLVLGIILESLEQRAAMRTGLEEKAAAHGSEKNIVSLFLDNASNDSGEQIDPTYLRDIVINFMLAGRDTTAQAMSWFFYSLDQNPHVETKIREELAAKIPALISREIVAPTMDQTASLVYLEAALKETLRLYPSVPSNFRQANRDTVLCDGTFVRKGTCVSMSAYAMARSERVWGVDAKVFNPMRWIEPDSGRLKPISSYQFSAFGAGPRRCLGVNLAINELKIVAASVLARFHLELVPGQHVTYVPSITLPMKNPLLVRIKAV